MDHWVQLSDGLWREQQKGGVQVKVKLVAYGMLRDKIQHLPGSYMRLEEGTTIQEILVTLQIPEEGLMYPLVNGRKVDLQHSPCHGDEVILLPPLAGG